MDRVFLDSDVLLNVLLKEEGKGGEKLWEAPVRILNLIGAGRLSGSTSIINLMEIRTVLSRKKKWKKALIFQKEKELKESLDILIPTWTDHIKADKYHRETFLYPMDCLILTLAGNNNYQLITRDSGLLSQEIVESVNPDDFVKTV
ncbi:MAG: PIN domain-containing protein [Euryarchaeota archaeon]|nr:PIN domain-containing protein [Euryarchaeota archaeon]